MSIASKRLILAREILTAQVDDPKFTILISPLVDMGGWVFNRLVNLVRTLTEPGNAELLADDVAWADIWRQLHITPAVFHAKYSRTEWVRSLLLASMTRTLLAVPNANGNYLVGHVYSAREITSIPSLGPLSAATWRPVNLTSSTSSMTAMEWLAISGGVADLGAPPRTHATPASTSD